MARLRPGIKKSFYIATILMFGLSLLAPLAPAHAEGEPPADPAPAGEEAEAPPDDGGEGEPAGEEEEDDAATAEGEAAVGSEEDAADEAADSDGGDGQSAETEGEVVADEGEAPAEEASLLEAVVEAALDPYYTVGTVLYQFFATGGACGGAPNCFDGTATPIQDAIDYLSGTLDAVPDDNTVYVEDGSYAETVSISGSSWASGLGDLNLQSENGSGSTTITGSVSIDNMLNFGLSGFTIDGGVSASGNNGTLTLSDIVVDGTGGSTSGHGIDVDHDGDVVVEKSNSSNNENGAGAWIVTINGSITVKDSTFNNNTDLGGQGNGLFARLNTAGAMIDVNGVTANDNQENGALLVYGPDGVSNVINVSNSTFKNNGDFGVHARPEEGQVTFKCLHTSGNTNGGTNVPVFDPAPIWLGCDKKGDHHEDGEKEFRVKLSTEKPKVVNAGNGIVVTFPPIEIIDEEKDPIGEVKPLDEGQLCQALPDDQIFGAAVDIQIINAVIPDGSSIQIDFHIPNWLWGSETLHVFWCNSETGVLEELSFEEVPNPEWVGGGVLQVNTIETGIFAATRDVPPEENGE